MRLAQGRMQLVTHAKVEGEIGRDLPIILREDGVRVATAIHGGVVGGADLGPIGIAEEEGPCRGRR